MTEEHLQIDPWSLTYAERTAISRLALKAEPVENLLGVGHITMNKLIEAGIAMEVDVDPHGPPRYGLTGGGRLIFDVLARTSRVVR